MRRRRADERQRYAAAQRFGRIDPNPHQIDAVIFALRRIPEGGCILADEVGLGKTIEAGLVIAQLMAEDFRRVLLIVPKPLVGQWQTELFTLFGIEAREGKLDPDIFAGDGVVVVHREFAGGERGASLLKTADPFDLVVIDEAHEVFASIYRRFDHEGNYNTASNEARTADRVLTLLRQGGTPVLLLTATPIQNSLAELWGLVHYVEPTGTLLGRLPTFRELFCGGTDRKLEPAQVHELRRRVSTVMQRTLRRQAQEFLEVPFVQRQARLLEYTMSFDEKALYDDVTSWLLKPYLCAFRGKQRALLLIAFHRRMASSLRALSASLEKVAERLRKMLESGVLEVEETDAVVFARDLELDPADFEDDAAVVEDEEAAPPISAERVRAELELVEGFARRAHALSADSKAARLLDAVRVALERGRTGEGSGKVVIFTESLTTQDFLAELLTKDLLPLDEVTLFRGQNDTARARAALARWEVEVGKNIPAATQPSREIAIRLALVHEFRHRSKVFISTEAGAKGLNLQFCETLINFDLPWNPQRIEQRIGRVHRYGQRRGVTVINFLNRDNEAQRLTFEILSQKLDLFGLVLDASDVVLHTPKSGASESLVSAVGTSFESDLRRIYDQAGSIEEITQRLKKLRETIDSARQEYDDEQARTASLIENRLDASVRQVFNRYRNELPAGLREIDRDLERLVSSYLATISVGVARTERNDQVLLDLEPSARLPEGYQEGVRVGVGHARDLTDAEPLHPGHALVRAAVQEARLVTPLTGTVTLRSPRNVLLPAALKPFRGRQGRLVVSKVAYRGIETVDHLVPTVVLSGESDPVSDDVARAVLALEPSDARPDGSAAVGDRLINELVEEAVIADQSVTTAGDNERFERMLEQVERYVDDQVLLLRRQEAALAERISKAERKRDAIAVAVRAQGERELKQLEAERSRIQARIATLEEREDADYRTWRDRILARRFRKPDVERLIDVRFVIADGTGAPC